MIIKWDVVNIDDAITVIIAAIALIFSIAAYISQKSFNKHSLTPACKIDVYSSKGSIKIVFRNVGNGIMKVNSVCYKDISCGERIELLSEWLKDIPCETNSEYNLDNTWLGTSMSYNLLSRTMTNQRDLDLTWDKLKKLHMDVTFEDTFGKKHSYTYDLEIDYKIYSVAKGDRDIVSISDYQCPLCKVTQTGKADE